MRPELAAALVRGWVGVYTRGLPVDVRRDRRDEIDDDIWSQAEDAAASGRTPGSLAGEMLLRLVLGMPADVSWRAEQRRLAPTDKRQGRVVTMRAPGTGLLAIIAGAGWAIWPIPQGIVGREWPAGDPLSLLLFLSVMGGTLATSGVMIGIVFAAQDQLRTWVTVVASIGAFLGVLAIAGAYQVIVLMPITSAVLLWELSRTDMVGARLARAHVASAVLFLVPMAVLLLSANAIDNQAIAVPLLALAIPYGLSWVAIGWSLLRSRAVVGDRVAGAGAAT